MYSDRFRTHLGWIPFRHFRDCSAKIRCGPPPPAALHRGGYQALACAIIPEMRSGRSSVKTRPLY
jgi:hypothetical protein